MENQKQTRMKENDANVATGEGGKDEK